MGVRIIPERPERTSADSLAEALAKAGAFALLVLLATLAGICFGSTSAAEQTEQLRAEAVKRGHAEYYLDDNRQRQWRWRDLK